VDRRKRVSQRLRSACWIASFQRGAPHDPHKRTVGRTARSDVYAALPAITGKLDSSTKVSCRAPSYAKDLIRRAAARRSRRGGGANVDDIVHWFDEGARSRSPPTSGRKHCSRLQRGARLAGPGRPGGARRQEGPGRDGSACELVLEGSCRKAHRAQRGLGYVRARPTPRLHRTWTESLHVASISPTGVPMARCSSVRAPRRRFLPAAGASTVRDGARPVAARCPWRALALVIGVSCSWPRLPS